MTSHAQGPRPEENRERTYRLAGTYNFRDIGGYTTESGQTVRWRRVFRSDAIHALTDEDMQQIRPLGIRTILDLRSQRERDATGTGSIHDVPGIRVVHIPFGRLGEEADPNYVQPSLPDLYSGIVAEASQSIGTVLNTLAEPDAQPAVIHCAAGKDRTGVSIAVLLGILGVPRETILEDYGLTGENYSEWFGRQPDEVRARFSHIPPELLRVDVAAMNDTLDIIERTAGSYEAFARQSGTTEASIARLRETLLTRD